MLQWPLSVVCVVRGTRLDVHASHLIQCRVALAYHAMVISDSVGGAIGASSTHGAPGEVSSILQGSRRYSVKTQ